MAWFKRWRELRRLAEQAEQNRRQAEAEAARNRQLKQEMTSNIAHELKTPVSSIRGYLEILLSDKPVSDEQRRYFLERCYRQTLRLSDLIQDVSIINKIEESSDLFPKQHTDLTEVVAEAVGELADRAAEEQLSVEVRLPSPLPLMGNRELLYSIFRNLTENAIAYAGGHCRVVIETYEPSRNPKFGPHDPQFLYLHFYDTGAGVADEYLSRLFDRFVRIDQGRSRRNGGTGLGLSIVKHAVQFHGGQIYAKNRPEGGLEYFFSLKKQ